MNGIGNMGNAKIAEKQSLIAAELEFLGRAVITTRDIVAKLENKIMPVLSPMQQPIDNADKEIPPPSRSLVADNVAASVRSLHEVKDSLNDLFDRLEV